MKEIGFVSWDEWKPILHQFNCPCCMGVRLMPDEEELERRLWRTMPWDTAVMVPTEKSDFEDEKEGDNE